MGVGGYRGKALVIWLAAVVLATLLVGYGATLVGRIQDAHHTWLTHSEQSLQVETALQGLLDQYADGGFIRDLDAALRQGSAAGLTRLEDKLQGLYGALERYRALPLADRERQALRVLWRTVDAYAGRLKLAMTLQSRGQSPTDSERQIPVDAGAASAALSVLQAHAERLRQLGRRRTSEALEQTIAVIHYGMVLVLFVILAAVLLVRDRQHIERINAALEKSGGYINDLLKAVPDALLVAGEDGRILRANAAAERLFAYSEQQLLAMTVEDLMPERFRHRHAAARNQAVAAAAARPMGPRSQFVILTGDGREVPVDIGLNYSRQDGRVHTLVSLRDSSELRQLETRLREQQEVFETAQAIAHVGSWDWQISDNTLLWSDEVYRIFGLQPQAAVPTYDTFLECVHPDDRDRVRQGISDALHNDRCYEVEHRVVQPGGSERIVLEMGQVFRDHAGEAVRMVGTVLDITERKQVEQQMLFDRAIIAGISQPVVVVDQQGCIDDVNPAYCEMSGYERGELLGRPANVLKSGRHDNVYYEGLWDSLAKRRKWQGEIWIRRKDGAIVPRLLSITTICEAELGQCRHVGFYSDITSLKESEAKLERLAHFDQLTGLANRMLFHDRLRAAIARAHRSTRQVAVLFVDLDGFKQVNDSLGHRTGDLLLVEVAERMKACVREDDTVARLGGDEFVLVLNEICSDDEVGELARRLREQLAISLGGGDDLLQVTASVGIAMYPRHGDQVTDLLEKADQAMYQAKQAGKNTVVFSGDAGADEADGVA